MQFRFQVPLRFWCSTCGSVREGNIWTGPGSNCEGEEDGGITPLFPSWKKVGFKEVSSRYRAERFGSVRDAAGTGTSMVLTHDGWDKNLDSYLMKKIFYLNLCFKTFCLEQKF